MPPMAHTDSTSTGGAALHQQTVGGHLRMLAQLDPDREALVAGDQEYRATYSELLEQTGLAARGLMATGVAHGDRVAIWAPERYEWVVLGLGAARAGAVLVAIDPACDAAELGEALEATGSRLVALSRWFRGADHEALLAQVRDRCPQLRSVLVLDGEWHAFLEEGTHVSECDLGRSRGIGGRRRPGVRPAGRDHAPRAARRDRSRGTGTRGSARWTRSPTGPAWSCRTVPQLEPYPSTDNEARTQGGRNMHMHEAVIRAATSADRDELSRLASASHHRNPRGHVLMAERDHDVVAAIELGSGAVLAGPDAPSSADIQTLRRARYQVLRQGNGVGYARSRLRRLLAAPAF